MFRCQKGWFWPELSKTCRGISTRATEANYCLGDGPPPRSWRPWRRRWVRRQLGRLQASFGQSERLKFVISRTSRKASCEA